MQKQDNIIETEFNTSTIIYKDHVCKTRVIHHDSGARGFVSVSLSGVNEYQLPCQIDAVVTVDLTSVDKLIREFWNAGITNPVFGVDYGKSLNLKDFGYNVCKSIIVHKGFELTMFIVKDESNKVTGYISESTKLDLTRLDYVIAYSEITFARSKDHKTNTIPTSESESESIIIEESPNQNTQIEKNEKSDNEKILPKNMMVIVIMISLDMQNNDILNNQLFTCYFNMKLFLKIAHKTKILSIYAAATRATAKWFDDHETKVVDSSLEPDLTSVLIPFKNKLNQLHSCIDFNVLSNLDRIFFGVRSGCYWKQDYGSPKIGTFYSSDDETMQVVVEHGLSTMNIEHLFSGISEAEISIFCKQKEKKICNYVKNIVKILDELNMH